jgi:small GTP-binding protein
MFCCGGSAEPVRKKVVLVGDTFSGKTCLQEVFRGGHFNSDHSPTVFLNYYCEMSAGDATVELSVWDTAGLVEFERMRPFSYAEADVVAICVPVDSSEARINLVEKWMPEVDYFCSNVPVVLVGENQGVVLPPAILR